MKKIDIALAVGLTAWMVAEVWAENLQPAGVTIPLTIVAGASLAWRRLYPIPVALLVTAVSIAEAAAGMTLHSAVSPVVALFLVSWSIGAYEDRRRAILGLTLLVSGVWVSMAVDMLRGTDHYVGTDFPWIGALVLAPGVLGIAFGARTRSLRAAEARTQLLELERREAIASERARIARELHDVIAHSVSVMTVQAGAAEEMLKTDPARAFEPVRAIQDTGRGALVEMKRLVGVLRDDDEDVGLAPQPGLGDVERLLEQMRNAGLRVDLRIEGAEATRAAWRGSLRISRHPGGADEHSEAHGRRTCDRRRALRRRCSGGRGDGCRQRCSRTQGQRPRARRHARTGGDLRRHVRRRARRCRRIRRASAPTSRRVRMTSVLLADDQALVRGGFRMILEAQEGLEVIAEAEDGRAAVERSRQLRPDVILMDVRMPGLDGIEATKIVVEEGLAGHVLVLTTFDEDRIVYDALRAGASGFLLKTVPPAQLVEAVRIVAAGEALLAPAVTRRLIEDFVRRPPPGGACLNAWPP